MHRPGWNTTKPTALRLRAEAFGDIARRVWNQSGDDNVTFLAGGLAFNVLLALVPFVLLLILGLSLLLGNQPQQAADTVTHLVQALLPTDAVSSSQLLRDAVDEVLRTRQWVGVYSAIAFVWSSTRLFGSLRSCLALVFDRNDHGIVSGKLWDFLSTLVTTLAIVVYVVFSTYLDMATTRGVAILVSLGLRESAMSGAAYVIGRTLAICVVFLLFYSFYRGVPRHRPSPRTATIAAGTAALLFEIARNVFAILVAQFDPSSLYTGTIATVVAVVFWTYYSSLLFLIGGEVAHAYDMRKNALAALDRPKMRRDVTRPVPTTTTRKPK